MPSQWLVGVTLQRRGAAGLTQQVPRQVRGSRELSAVTTQLSPGGLRALHSDAPRGLTPRGSAEGTTLSPATCTVRSPHSCFRNSEPRGYGGGEGRGSKAGETGRAA